MQQDALRLRRLGAFVLVVVGTLAFHRLAGIWAAWHRPSSKVPPFFFLHVPKAGGQSARRHLASCTGAVELEADAHVTSESMVLARGQRPLVVLREPLDRLRSAYEFWRGGSDMKSMRKLRGPAIERRAVLAHALHPPRCEKV